MKNKKLTYILLPVVIAIWGIIFYKIFQGVNDNGMAQNVSMENIQPVKKDLNVPDTFSLLENYRDPFLGRSVIFNDQSRSLASSIPAGNTPKVQEPKPAPVQAPWPAISYSGMIRNQRSDVQLAMLSVNGQSHTVKAGQAVDGITIVKIYRDSIQVQFLKEKRVFRK